MKAIRIAIGLVFDDAWLFGGVLVSAALAFIVVTVGARTVGGFVFLAGVVASLALSSARSARRR